MKWKPYQKYKKSGVGWIIEIPEHWSEEKLKFIAKVNPSNVDKDTAEGERPVCLCNYTDVYNNEFINSEMNLMCATASPSEIEKFQLKPGDVLVTKDSEEWSDIAVPAYVVSSTNNTLCGYHLAQVRPLNSNILGEYLFRAFSARGINDQFRVEASGITRYGLGKYSLDSGIFPVPSLEEQLQIVNVIKKQTTLIDNLIAKKQRQIELLQEKRSTLISHVVTKGLNPNVKMKDSGVEWLGKIPEHWGMTVIKRIAANRSDSIVDGPFGSSVNVAEDYTDFGVPVIRTVNIANTGFRDENLMHMREEKYHQLKRHAVYPGDVLFSKVGTIGNSCIFPNEFKEGILSTTGSCKITPNTGKITSLFLTNLLFAMTDHFKMLASSNVQPFLNMETIKNVSIPVPLIDEQNAITERLLQQCKILDNIKCKISKSISLLQEYRSALISAAATGKIDVRQEVIND